MAIMEHRNICKRAKGKWASQSVREPTAFVHAKFIAWHFGFSFHPFTFNTAALADLRNNALLCYRRMVNGNVQMQFDASHTIRNTQVHQSRTADL